MRPPQVVGRVVTQLAEKRAGARQVGEQEGDNLRGHTRPFPQSCGSATVDAGSGRGMVRKNCQLMSRFWSERCHRRVE